jgi:adenosylhomocysteine nucleosidase
MKIAIIAALEREVRPLIRRWKPRMIEQNSRRYRVYESGETALICGGIGAEAARRATEAIIREVNPMRVISVGFAGALNRSLQVGDVLQPRTVINAVDGVRTDVGSGEGILLSASTVVGKEQKVRFAKAYDAGAVDMEAAAVAQGAQARGVEFAALKAISDDASFDLPEFDRYVAGDGSFRGVRFAGHVALRPWLWSSTITLARNSSKASAALCGALADYLAEYFSRESSVSELNPIDVSQAKYETCAGAHTVSGTQAHTRVTGKQ